MGSVERPPLGEECWEDTRLALPPELAGGLYRNLFTGEVLSAEQAGDVPSLPVAKVLAGFPVALLERVSA